MQALIDLILSRLRGQDQTEVYPSFDAVPVSKKSDALFVVVTPESLQMDEPFPDGVSGAVPFAAVVKVSVLIPMTTAMETAEDYFWDVVVPRMKTISKMPFAVTPAHVDVKLGRVVMDGKFRFNGVYLEEVEG